MMRAWVSACLSALLLWTGAAQVWHSHETQAKERCVVCMAAGQAASPANEAPRCLSAFAELPAPSIPACGAPRPPAVPPRPGRSPPYSS